MTIRELRTRTSCMIYVNGKELGYTLASIPSIMHDKEIYSIEPYYLPGPKVTVLSVLVNM